MQYAIQVVGNEELPEGVDRVIVERENEPPLMLISGELARCWRFVRAYEDALEPCELPSIMLPALLHAV